MLTYDVTYDFMGAIVPRTQQAAALGLTGPMACSTVFLEFVKLGGNRGTYQKCAFFKFFLERRDCSQLEISSKGGEYAMLQHCAGIQFIQTPTVKKCPKQWRNGAKE